MKKTEIIEKIKKLLKKNPDKCVNTMSELLMMMNEKPNDYDFGGEARVFIQDFEKDLNELEDNN